MSEEIKMMNSRMGTLLALATGIGGDISVGRSCSREQVGRSAKSPEEQARLIVKANAKRDRRRLRNLSNLSFAKRYAHQ